MLPADRSQWHLAFSVLSQEILCSVTKRGRGVGLSPHSPFQISSRNATVATVTPRLLELSAPALRACSADGAAGRRPAVREAAHPTPFLQATQEKTTKPKPAGVRGRALQGAAVHSPGSPTIPQCPQSALTNGVLRSGHSFGGAAGGHEPRRREGARGLAGGTRG